MKKLAIGWIGGLMLVGCQGQVADDTAVRFEAVSAEDGVLLRCEDARGGPVITLEGREDGTFEAFIEREEGDSYDRRDTYTVRETYGVYDACQVAEEDPRILSCWKLEDTGTTGRVVFTSTKVERQQLPIGGGSLHTRRSLALFAYDADRGIHTRPEFRLEDCVVPEPEAPACEAGEVLVDGECETAVGAFEDCSGGRVCADGACATNWDGYFCYYTACMPTCADVSDCEEAAIAAGIDSREVEGNFFCNARGLCETRLEVGGVVCE